MESNVVYLRTEDSLYPPPRVQFVVLQGTSKEVAQPTSCFDNLVDALALYNQSSTKFREILRITKQILRDSRTEEASS